MVAGLLSHPGGRAMNHTGYTGQGRGSSVTCDLGSGAAGGTLLYYRSAPTGDQPAMELFTGGGNNCCQCLTDAGWNNAGRGRCPPEVKLGGPNANHPIPPFSAPPRPRLPLNPQTQSLTTTDHKWFSTSLFWDSQSRNKSVAGLVFEVRSEGLVVVGVE